MGRRQSTSRRKKDEAGQVEDPSPILAEESVPFLMRHTSRRFFKALQIDLSRYQITSSIWYFLRVLWNEEGLSQAELSQRVGLMTPTTTSTLNNMERMGLIERHPYPSDKRKHLIHLTQKGHDLKPELMRAAMNVHKLATKGLTNEQLSVLRDTIHIMERNLDQMIGDTAEPADAFLRLNDND